MDGWMDVCMYWKLDNSRSRCHNVSFLQNSLYHHTVIFPGSSYNRREILALWSPYTEH